MKTRIEFIIMKISMKIVKICPKSPRFTVHKFMQNGTVLIIFFGVGNSKKKYLAHVLTFDPTNIQYIWDELFPYYSGSVIIPSAGN